MSPTPSLTRRQFLSVGLTTAGALLVGVDFAGCARNDAPPIASKGDETPFGPNAWIRIARDNSITLLVPSSEMGQGVMTALPMLLAEELDADWSKVQAEFAPAHAAYFNPLMRRQQTGSSTAVRGFWGPLREAGAAVREMLVTAAAKTWSVPLSECTTALGEVIHTPSNRRTRYGELIEAAAKQKIPENAFTKDSSKYRYLGKAIPRLDTPSKVNGGAVFGQDVRLDRMLIAAVARCPEMGGKAKKFNKEAAAKVKGVRNVVEISSGIAVIADHFWAALKGREALAIEWIEGSTAELNSAAIRSQFKSSAKSGKVANKAGNVEDGLRAASKTVEAVYEVPYLAHACMEPMNCVAHVRDSDCDIWVPTQGQTATQRAAAKVLGFKPEQVNVHTTFLGGGFGRRSETDFVVEAVELSKAVGVPVKVMWTREDDIQHDFYRPATYNELTAGISKDGSVVAWIHRIAGPSIISRLYPDGVKDGIDGTSVEIAAQLPYSIPNMHVTYAMVNTAIPVGFWRSVGASQNAFITECFLDEVAHAAQRDPFDLRRSLLKDQPRARAVLELAAEKSQWGSPVPTGIARGIAVAHSFASFVAHVAEVSITEGKVRVHRVVCAVDCGFIVNPGIVAAQMESAVAYALTAALYGEITIENGRVQQSNFNNYPLLRIDEMPNVEVHFVHSDEPPGGVGEPGVPPLAPAVCNAIFALTGKPIRSLPIRL